MAGYDVPTESSELRTLYQPQTEQLGMKLHHRAGGLEGGVDNDSYRGRIRISPVGPHCLVIWHDITFLRDTELSEYSLTDYACLIASDAQDPLPLPDGTQTCTSKEGSMVSLIQPAGTVTYHMPAGSRSCTRSISILPDYFVELNHKWPGQVGGLFESFGQPWLPDAYWAASTALSKIGPGQQDRTGFLLKAHIDLMLATLSQTSSATMQDSESSSDGDLARQTEAYIQSHLDGDLSIDQIARSLYVGRTHLCTAFSKQTGTSLAKYIRGRRIHQARHLLVTTKENIAWVGRQVGYNLPSSFTAAFTRETGLAPGTWRQRRACAESGLAHYSQIQVEED